MTLSQVDWEAVASTLQVQDQPEQHSQILSQNSSKDLEVISECEKDSGFNPRTTNLNKRINK